MIIELMGHQNVGKEIQFSFFGEVQMSRIAHTFDLSHHKLASLHFKDRLQSHLRMCELCLHFCFDQL